MKIFISLITTQVISTIIAFTEFEEPKEIITLSLELTGLFILLLLNKFNLSELLQRVILLGQAILVFVLMPDSQYKYFTGAYHIIFRLTAYQQVSRVLMLEWTGLLLIIFIFGTQIEIHEIFRSIFCFVGLLIIQGFHFYAQMDKDQREPEIMVYSKVQYTGYDSNPRSLNERIIDPNYYVLHLDDQYNAIGFQKQNSTLQILENGMESILNDLIINKIDSKSKSILQWKSSGSLQNLLDQIRANRIPMVIQILDYSHPQMKNQFIKIIYQNDFQIQFLELEERDRFQKQKYIFAILKQLLSTMSHEFGTSLNYLLAIAQVAIEKYTDSDLLSYFMPIKSMGLIMHNFVLDMVDYNNIQGKKLELLLEKIDINQLLEEVINIFQHTLQQKGLKITYEIFLAEKTILTDGRRLKQILITLIQNSQKFTFQGVIKITVKSIEQNKYVQFEIQDSGIGMTKSEIDNLTDMLKYDYKQENKISKNTAGFGLGSFLCNKIAISLSNLKYEEGGGIRYYSGQEIKGTKVVFKIINEPFSMNYTMTIVPSDNSSGILKIGKNAIIDIKQSQIELGLSAIKQPLIKKYSSVMVPKVNSFHDDPVVENFMKKTKTKDKIGTLYGFQMQQTRKDQDSINDETNQEDYQKRLQFQNIRLSTQPQQSRSSRQSSYNEIQNEVVNCNCKSILIVDDEMINILGLQLMLKSFHLESDSSYNGQEALTKLENAHCLYNFIFMDINMPIMDGFTSTKAILEKYKQDAPIIIACTAFTDSETKQYCYEIGMSHFINKPVNKNELQKLLCYLIN